MKELYTLADLQTWDPKESAIPIRLGVLGDPIAHSLSPQLQNAALSNCGIPMRYARFQIRPEELADAFDLIRKNEFVGMNLTVPHKVPALDLVDEVDEEARQIGAINTVAVRAGKLLGYNTDGLGISRAISVSFKKFLAQLNPLVLGAGGVARAIATQCVRENCAHLFLSNRTRQKAEELRDRLMAMGNATEITVVEQDVDSLRRALGKADLVINATSLGLRSFDQSLVRRELLTKKQFVYDTIYDPPETKLLEEARAAGAIAVNGLTMLLYQGAASFERWFDREAPITAMHDALEM